MQSTQPSSDEWSDDAIKTLLAYGGWQIEWSDEDEMWIIYPPQHTLVGSMFATLKDVHAYYLDYMKWWHDDCPEPEDDNTPGPP